MVRGVIAYALCLQVEGRDEEFIQTFGLIMVMITTVLGSSFLKPFAACIGLDE
jgi:NhaP-type Na+/H+ or K+/H+ antiporter